MTGDSPGFASPGSPPVLSQLFFVICLAFLKNNPCRGGGLANGSGSVLRLSCSALLKWFTRRLFSSPRR